MFLAAGYRKKVMLTRSGAYADKQKCKVNEMNPSYNYSAISEQEEEIHAWLTPEIKCT